MSRITCKECQHGDFYLNGPQGTCRLNPPAAFVVVMPAGKIAGQVQPVPLAAFPTVNEDHWCSKAERASNIALN